MHYYDKQIKKCRTEFCDSKYATDYERGEVLCETCGTVVREYLPDMSHDTRTYTPEEFNSQTRTGPQMSLMVHDQGLSTTIGNNRDSTGRMLSSQKKREFTRLRMWDQRSKSRSAASMSKAFTLLHAIKTKLAIPYSVVERAAYIYRKAVSMGLTKGRTVASLASASLYIACRESDTPRTLDEIVTISNVDKKTLFRDLRTMLRKMDINLNQYDTSYFVAKISNEISLRESTKREALNILRKSERSLLTAGKRPIAMAAAAIYIAALASGEQITQRSLAKISKVSDVTIRNGVILMREKLCIKN